MKIGKHRGKITREQSISGFEKVGLIQGSKANDTYGVLYVKEGKMRKSNSNQLKRVREKTAMNKK